MCQVIWQLNNGAGHPGFQKASTYMYKNGDLLEVIHFLVYVFWLEDDFY